MTRLACPFAAMLALVARIGFACEPIAVLSHDARYMVLDGDTLDVVDVGSLWWQGIFEVDLVFRGSTSERFAFASDRLSPELTRLGKDGRFPISALVVVDWRSNADDPIAMSHDFSVYAGEVDQTLWINGTDRLLYGKHADDKWMFTVLDTRLRTTDYWEEEGDKRERTAFGCLGAGGVVLGGRHGNITRRGEQAAVGPLAQPENTQDCRLCDLSLGCIGRMGCRRNGREVHASFDISRHAVVAAYERPRSADPDIGHLPARRVWFSTRLLFAGGTRLLRQERIATLVPDTVGYVTKPTARIHVLDAETGEIVNENNTAPLGEVSRLFCEGATERAVLSASRRVHLLNLKTLAPLASATVPFDQFFVF